MGYQTQTAGVKVCFILDHNLMSYRIPLFKGIADLGYEVSIMHKGREIENVPFLTQIITTSINFFGFQYRKNPNLNNYDIVVHMQNIRLLNLWFITLNPFRKYKLIHWGIGVSSSSGLQLKKSFMSIARNFLAEFSDSQILYSEFALTLFSKRVRNKTFIANNTIDNPASSDLSNYEKSTFLFIGSLNSRKGLELLIKVYAEYLNLGFNKKLIIIGSGGIKDNLVRLVEDYSVSDQIVFAGNITQSDHKISFFKTSLASISLKQAGLSVLESFSFGVPFITYSNAISGGEHLNVINDYNGFVINSETELLDCLVRLSNEPVLARNLGENAFKYYNKHRPMSEMVNSFDDTFKFVLNNNKKC